MPNTTHPRRRRRSRISWPRVFLLVLAAFLLLAVLVVGAYRLWARSPEVEAPPPAESAQTSQVIGQLQRKDDFYTVLISGLDDHNGGSDTNILLGFDAQGGAVRGVSIPRDSGVWYQGKAHKVNAASKQGAEELAAVLEDTLGIPVDFTVQVDLGAFAALVNAIGGVEFNVPIDMDYDDPLQDLSIHFKAGLQHLDGEEALKVVRFRQNNDGTGYGTQDIGRIATQQAFLKTVAAKMLANPGKIS